MKIEYKQVKDICGFVGGSQPPKSSFIYEPREGYVRLIQTRDYKSNDFPTYIPIDSTKKFCDKNDIMIGRYGPPVFQILRGLEGAYNVALMKAVPKKEIDRDFLYYFLKQDSVFKYVDKLSARTGGQTGVDLVSLNQYPVRIPEKIENQKLLVASLKVVDKKIELNNQINAELESMTRTLYDYWFVQFDFPDADGKPYKSSGGKMVYNEVLKREIPEQWEAKPLLDITSVSNHSVDPAKNSEILFKLYSIPVFDVTNSYSIEKGNSIGSNKFTVEKLDLLVSKLNPWFNRVVYALDLQDQICSTEFVVWRCPSLSIKNFMYLIATSDQFISHCTQSATGTSNSHKRVNPNVMMGFVQPFDKEIAEQFGETADPMIKTIMANRQENLQLEKLRDWLLPMLMNGQVTVK